MHCKYPPENDCVLDTNIGYWIKKNVGTGRTCKEWRTGLIYLIPKEGPMNGPNNYWELCVVNALMKIQWSTTHYL